MAHAFQVDSRGIRIRKTLIALGEAVARYTRFEFDEGAGKPAGAGLYVVNHGFAPSRSPPGITITGTFARRASSATSRPAGRTPAGSSR